MRRGHGNMVMAVMASVMAVMACQVKFEGSPTQPAMTGVVPAMTQTATPSMTAAPVMEGDCLIVRASAGDDGALNLRKGPGVGYAVMVVMPDGQTLRKMSSASAGDWIKVRVDMDGRWWIGYVRSLYVRPCD